jgi:hypothetical protein
MTAPPSFERSGPDTGEGVAEFRRFLRRVHVRAAVLLFGWYWLCSLLIICAPMTAVLMLRPTAGQATRQVIAASLGLSALSAIAVAFRRRRWVQTYIATVDDRYDAAGRIVAAVEFLRSREPLDAYKRLAIADATQWLARRPRTPLPWHWKRKRHTAAVVALILFISLPLGCTSPELYRSDNGTSGRRHRTATHLQQTPAEGEHQHPRTASNVQEERTADQAPPERDEGRGSQAGRDRAEPDNGPRAASESPAGTRSEGAAHKDRDHLTGQGAPGETRAQECPSRAPAGQQPGVSRSGQSASSIGELSGTEQGTHAQGGSDDGRSSSSQAQAPPAQSATGQPEQGNPSQQAAPSGTLDRPGRESAGQGEEGDGQHREASSGAASGTDQGAASPSPAGAAEHGRGVDGTGAPDTGTTTSERRQRPAGAMGGESAGNDAGLDAGQLGGTTGEIGAGMPQPGEAGGSPSRAHRPAAATQVQVASGAEGQLPAGPQSPSAPLGDAGRGGQCPSPGSGQADTGVSGESPGGASSLTPAPSHDGAQPGGCTTGGAQSGEEEQRGGFGGLEAGTTSGPKRDQPGLVHAPTRDVAAPQSAGSDAPPAAVEARDEGEGFADGVESTPTSRPTGLNEYRSIEIKDVMMERVSPTRRALIERYFETLRAMSKETQPTSRPTTRKAD